MNINTIVKLVNKKLAGEMLSYSELEPFLDQTVDYINAQLNSCFPTFSENNETEFTTTYDYIPDKYIRTVIIPGAAWNFYVMDEEGTNTALQFQSEYYQNLYYMVRDYIEQVPEEYQCDSIQGSMKFNFYETIGTPGMEVNNTEGLY